MMDEKVIKDIKKAQCILKQSSVSLVVIKQGDILHQRTGKGVAPFIDLIDSTTADFSGCVIGDRLLGRASAFLCRYVNAAGVYAEKGTKKALAVLLVGNILGQIDTFIDQISNQTLDGLCPFERAVTEIKHPTDAYTKIKETLNTLKNNKI